MSRGFTMRGVRSAGRVAIATASVAVVAALGLASPASATAGTDADSAGSLAAQTCSTAGLGDPHTCAQAVTWAKNHRSTAYHSDYDGLCDHIAGLEYGFPHSGSTTAAVHWTQIPAAKKHAGDTSVPAGGLAFFGGGSGHVMISIGGGTFISNDIHGAGTLTNTTIAEIKSKWGKPYLGWAQPWFKYNH
ncbi:MAG: hypothetical protein WCA46_16590 [Actinocatenispora sp.]